MKRILSIARKRANFGYILGFFLAFIAGVGSYALFNSNSARETVRLPLFQRADVAEAAVEDNGQGFLDTDGFGWASTNCVNDWNEDDRVDLVAEDQCRGAASDYGLHLAMVGFDGSLEGFVWSPHVGLICFGRDACGLEVAPDGRPAEATLSLGEQGITTVQGWARAVAHSSAADGQGGWIQLDGSTEEGTVVEVVARVEGVAQGSYFTITGSGWQRNLDAVGLGWVDFNMRTRNGIAAVPPGLRVRPPREIACGQGSADCCSNNRDDDGDRNYNQGDLDDSAAMQWDTNESTGVDCFDYECAGLRFYSTTYNPEAVLAYEHCGVVPAGGNFENALDDADCFDGFDNDLDGGFDCDDNDCQDAINPDDVLDRCVDAELNPGRFEFCGDGIDNDGDGTVDCRDSDCLAAAVCQPDNLIDPHPNCAVVGGCTGQSVDPEADNFCDDQDSDLICDDVDNCPNASNSDQSDSNGNGLGDLCDAYLKTEQGTIYARGFQAPAEAPAPNATFCLLSSGLVRNFNSATAQCAATLDERAQEFRILQYADTIALWSQALKSRIDLAGLIAERYGRVLTTSAGQEGRVLDEIRNTESQFQVLLHQGDFVLSGSLVIPTGRGGITIIVEGDLQFASGAEISYGTPVSADPRIVSSVAWIVVDPDLDDGVAQGNLSIDSAVEQLAGVFFSAGSIATGTGGRPLTVYGLMVARQFSFDRQYAADPSRGAELIIYDGRILLNPPPGTADLTKTLPIFRTVAR